MSLAGFNLKFSRHIQQFLFVAVIFIIISSLFVQWQKINEKAVQAQQQVLINTLTKSASSLRQKWELNNKPERMTVNGINVSYTRYGWPIVLDNNHVNCEKTWELLSPKMNPVSYADLHEKKEMRSAYYNSCYFRISDGNWLALFYENETIHIDSFLTRAELW